MTTKIDRNYVVNALVARKYSVESASAIADFLFSIDDPENGNEYVFDPQRVWSNYVEYKDIYAAAKEFEWDEESDIDPQEWIESRADVIYVGDKVICRSYEYER